MLKFGTVKELERVKNDMPEVVYKEALKTVTMLDKEYSADRDIDESDGGFCLVAGTVQDVSFINENYIKTNSGRHEYAKIIKAKHNIDCVEAFFLTNNEFGITVYFLNYGIAPNIILRDLECNTKK